MELKEQIYKRRSVRQYTDTPVTQEIIESITDFISQAKPLYPEIDYCAKFVTQEQVRFYFPWKTPQLLAIFSENKPGYLENVGFVLQQVDLYLQSIGLGSCWLGMGKLKGTDISASAPGMEFVILLAFGYPKDAASLTQIRQFNRKALSEIGDTPDPRLEPARVAPSSTNSQPWYFTHAGDIFHAYRSCAGIIRHKLLGTMNQIDMGIALAHLYVANPHTFRFFREDSPQEIKGHIYTGSFTL